MIFTLDQGFRVIPLPAASQQELAERLRAELPHTDTDRVEALAQRAWVMGRSTHVLTTLTRGEG